MTQEFFVVGTPIGNLGDISKRALEILASVDVVLCEDTRQTKKLLSHYGVSTRCLSYHAHSGDNKIKEIFDLLERGQKIALVSDAGTPGISDPGSELVEKLRDKFPGLKISAVPGPSALTAALSVAGVPTSDFLFLGFLPHKKGRETLFREIAESKRAVVFYESPHRIMKTLEKLAVVLDENRKVVICRELTKLFESVIAGSPKQVFEHFANHPDEVRGEFVVIVNK